MTGPDPKLTLEIVERLSKLCARHMPETRRTADLMCRIVAPSRPYVAVYASASQLNGGGQQVNSHTPIGLGDDRR